LTLAQSRTHASFFSYPLSKMQMQQNEINAFSVSTSTLQGLHSSVEANASDTTVFTYDEAGGLGFVPEAF